MGHCHERSCKEKHNTFLHPTVTQQMVANFSKRSNTKFSNNHSILSTASIEVQNTNQKKKVRALLNCGNQSTFITKSLQQKLRLNINPIYNNVSVVGIGNVSKKKESRKLQCPTKFIDNTI